MKLDSWSNRIIALTIYSLVFIVLTMGTSSPSRTIGSLVIVDFANAADFLEQDEGNFDSAKDKKKKNEKEDQGKENDDIAILGNLVNEAIRLQLKEVGDSRGISKKNNAPLENDEGEGERQGFRTDKASKEEKTDDEEGTKQVDGIKREKRRRRMKRQGRQGPISGFISALSDFDHDNHQSVLNERISPLSDEDIAGIIERASSTKRRDTKQKREQTELLSRAAAATVDLKSMKAINEMLLDRVSMQVNRALHAKSLESFKEVEDGTD